MAASNALVSAMVDAINNGEDHTLLVDERLRYGLKAIGSLPNGKDKMLLGFEGMPKTSKKLVEMGVYYIDGQYGCLHRDIYRALQEQRAKFERFLERLKRANDGEPLTEQELAELA